MARIATYVFMDLETTSLPSLELNQTRIVELSMVVMKRRHMLETRAGALPRVQHKLTMCFNPGRNIDPGASQVTGLDNFLVEYESPFNVKVFNTIDSFLGCLEKPVCLIAENGHTFDFPILKNHFERFKMQLPDDILCADSLYAFYDILKMLNINGDVDNLCVPDTQNTKQVISSGSPDEVDEVASLGNRVNNSNKSINSPKLDEEADLDENNVTNDKLTTQLYKQKQNETTPKTRQENMAIPGTQQQNKPASKIRPAKRIHEARRKLFFEGNEKPKLNYKLKNIYERVLCRPANDAHRAENDCIMTAEISIVKAKQFVEWVDQNSCAFAEVKPMRPGVPLGH